MMVMRVLMSEGMTKLLTAEGTGALSKTSLSMDFSTAIIHPLARDNRQVYCESLGIGMKSGISTKLTSVYYFKVNAHSD